MGREYVPGLRHLILTYCIITIFGTVEEFVLGVRYTPLEELIEKSDVITINTPLTPETDGMFNRDLLFKMKKGYNLNAYY